MLALIIGAAQAPVAAAQWSAPLDLNLSGDATEPQVAVDGDGDAVFVWENSSGRIEALTRASGGSLGPVQAVFHVSQTARRPSLRSRSTPTATR